MSDAQILEPMLAMMVLTLVIWVWLYARRIPAMYQAGKPAQAYTTADKATELLPDAVNYPSSNFKNLFELPVLFYALCLYLFVTGTVERADVIAAWAFVALRAGHSLIHCTVNVVMARFAFYLAASIALFFILARAVHNAWSGGLA